MTTRELVQRCLNAVPANNYRLRDDIRAHLAKPDETAELLREMGEALDVACNFARDYDDCPFRQGEEALAKFREMTK